jgi:hypothetical protein
MSTLPSLGARGATLRVLLGVARLLGWTVRDGADVVAGPRG